MHSHLYNPSFSPEAAYPRRPPSPEVSEPLPFQSAQIPNMFAPEGLARPEFDYVREMMSLLNSEVNNNNNSSSSGCSSYGSPSSLSSYVTQRPSLIPRSVSSYSLEKSVLNHRPTAPFCRLWGSEGSVRRVYSAGDLQRIKEGQRTNIRSESPLSSESNMIIEGMSKACRYSPEEKKERIERYRSKRNLRNFNKKIKYACRKTLADSRPRIRGRFARNEEIEKHISMLQWNHEGALEEDEEENDDWLSILDAYSKSLMS